MSKYLGNLGYVLYLHLHILLFIYSTVSLVNLANYLEPWADIQVSTHISCKLGQLSRALGWYSSLSHMPWHTVQIQMSSLIRVYTVCHSVCTVWAHYSTEEPHSSNFRVITTSLLGVQICRKFTVCFVPPSSHSYVHILNHISCKLGQLSRALGWYSNLKHITCNLGQLSRALCWYSSLNHISCKLGQLSWALGWYSSLNHISCKLGQLSRALRLIFKSQPYL